MKNIYLISCLGLNGSGKTMAGTYMAATFGFDYIELEDWRKQHFSDHLRDMDAKGIETYQDAMHREVNARIAQEKSLVLDTVAPTKNQQRSNMFLVDEDLERRIQGEGYSLQRVALHFHVDEDIAAQRLLMSRGPERAEWTMRVRRILQEEWEPIDLGPDIDVRDYDTGIMTVDDVKADLRHYFVVGE